MTKKNKNICWLCGGNHADTKIKVSCEIPNGKKCKAKIVKVHFSCYMDMDN